MSVNFITQNTYPNAGTHSIKSKIYLRKGHTMENLRCDRHAMTPLEKLEACRAVKRKCTEISARLVKLETIIELITLNTSEEPAGETRESIEYFSARLEAEKEKLKDAVMAYTPLKDDAEIIIAMLPGKYRGIIACRYIDGLEWDDIARKLNKSTTACTRTNFSAKQYLCKVKYEER